MSAISQIADITNLGQIRPGMEPLLDELVAIASRDLLSREQAERGRVLSALLGLDEGGAYYINNRLAAILQQRKLAKVPGL